MLRITPYGAVTRYDLARTLAGKGRYWTTAYLVDGMLVDTGCAHSAHEFVQTLGDSPLTHIVNSHSHEDHIGANGLLQRQLPGLLVLAHPFAVPVLADPRHKQPLHPYRRLFWGWPAACTGQPVSDGQVIATENYHFQVLYTPGHSPDHICLYEPDQGWMFTGDLFVGGKERALRADYDIWGIITSLKRIASLPLKVMYPGSARVPEDPVIALKQKISYLEELGGRVLDLHRRGWSVPAISRAVYGKSMWVEWVTLGHFSRRWLVLSYLGQNHER